MATPSGNRASGERENERLNPRGLFQKQANLYLIIICALTGQYLFTQDLWDSGNGWTKKMKKVVWAIPAILFPMLMFLVNLAPVVLVLIDWILCSVGEVYNVCYLLNVQNTTVIPTIILPVIHGAEASSTTDSTPNSADYLNDSHTEANLAKFDDFAKLVVLFFAVSSFLSYALIQCTLMKTYYFPNQNTGGNTSPLHPFCEKNNTKITNEHNDTSTSLQGSETTYFNILLLLNIVTWVAMVTLYYVERFINGNSKTKTNKLSLPVEGVGFGLFMYSIFCSIGSCFLFSKLASSVIYRCKKLEAKFYVSRNSELNALQQFDEKFINKAQKTLNLFEVWFTVHWICYTMSSFLAIALLIEAISMVISARLPADNKDGILFSAAEFGLLGVFTFSHCLLFFYPCFKAAAVTVARERLIKKVNDIDLGNFERKTHFVNYLKNKRFGFRISFLCARLRFNFNVAYVSIFIGALGVLIKVSSGI